MWKGSSQSIPCKIGAVHTSVFKFFKRRLTIVSLWELCILHKKCKHTGCNFRIIFNETMILTGFPKNICTNFWVFGGGTLNITWFVYGSTWILVAKRQFPKTTPFVIIMWCFSILRERLLCLHHWNVFSRLYSASSKSIPYGVKSSIYILTLSLTRSEKIPKIYHWKVAGALQIPKGRTWYANVPQGKVKFILSCSLGKILIWLYLLNPSRIEKYFFPKSVSRTLLINGKGKWCFCVALFNYR
jgi:hypothetical protein